MNYIFQRENSVKFNRNTTGGLNCWMPLKGLYETITCIKHFLIVYCWVRVRPSLTFSVACNIL